MKTISLKTLAPFAGFGNGKQPKAGDIGAVQGDKIWAWAPGRQTKGNARAQGLVHMVAANGQYELVTFAE